MSKFYIFCLTLALTGCGKEFTAGDPLSSEAGEAGEIETASTAGSPGAAGTKNLPTAGNGGGLITAGHSGSSGNSGSSDAAGTAGSSGNTSNEGGSAGFITVGGSPNAGSGNSAGAGEGGISGSGSAGASGSAGSVSPSGGDTQVAGSSGSPSGGAPPVLLCVPNTGCADDDNPCTDDLCNDQGTACTHPAKTNGVSCGSSSSSDCDDVDSCQNGACQQNFKPSNTACASDGNVCTNDVCNGAGSCTHQAAPAQMVCRTGSCLNGVVTAEATCGGSVTCPDPTTTQCYGACNVQANACVNTPPTKIEEVYNVQAADNDANYLYVSARTQAGVSQIVRYAKSDSTKTVLYQSIDSTEWIYAMIVAGNYIYFSETFWTGGSNPTSGKVSRIPTSGSSTADFVSSQATFGFAKNSARVYWNDGLYAPSSTPATHHVYSVTIGGTSVTTFAMNFGGTEIDPDIEVTDSDLYVWEMDPLSAGSYKPYLVRFSLTDPINVNASLLSYYFKQPGNTEVDLRSGSAFATMPGLTKDGAYIFANVGTDSDGTALFSFKISDDSRMLLANANSSNFPAGDFNPTMNFEADDNFLYFGNKRVAVTGGSLSYWVNHSLGTPSTLTLDSTSLYFGSYGYWTSQPYSGTPTVPFVGWFKVTKP